MPWWARLLSGALEVPRLGLRYSHANPSAPTTVLPVLYDYTVGVGLVYLQNIAHCISWLLSCFFKNQCGLYVHDAAPTTYADPLGILHNHYLLRPVGPA